MTHLDTMPVEWWDIDNLPKDSFITLTIHMTVTYGISTLPLNTTMTSTLKTSKDQHELHNDYSGLFEISLYIF